MVEILQLNKAEIPVAKSVVKKSLNVAIYRIVIKSFTITFFFTCGSFPHLRRKNNLEYFYYSLCILENKLQNEHGIPFH